MRRRRSGELRRTKKRGEGAGEGAGAEEWQGMMKEREERVNGKGGRKMPRNEEVDNGLDRAGARKTTKRKKRVKRRQGGMSEGVTMPKKKPHTMLCLFYHNF